MAMPTSAAASAGASLTPSPAIATFEPFAFRSSTRACLPSGVRSAWMDSMSTCSATAAAVSALSPVAMRMWRPCFASAWMASAAPGLMGSATARRPARRPSRDTKRAVLPLVRKPSAAATRASGSIPSSPIIAWFPNATSRPDTLPRTPFPVTDENRSTTPTPRLGPRRRRRSRPPADARTRVRGSPRGRA